MITKRDSAQGHPMIVAERNGHASARAIHLAGNPQHVIVIVREVRSLFLPTPCPNAAVFANISWFELNLHNEICTTILSPKAYNVQLCMDNTRKNDECGNSI